MYGSYNQSQVWNLGGFPAIQKRLVQKLGPPHLYHDPTSPNSTETVRIWKFPDVEREITLRRSDGVTISVKHLPRLQIVKAREAAYELKEQRKAESRNAGF
jgi:hypothetical protein